MAYFWPKHYLTQKFLEIYFFQFCGSYNCVAKTYCQQHDKTYLPFYKIIDGSPQAQGFACHPKDKIPNETFECFFNPMESYILSFYAKMTPIEKLYDNDSRNITIISWDNYVDVENYPLINLFDQSSCVGNSSEGTVSLN